MFEEQLVQLRKDLQKNARRETKVWWENYVKGSAPFMGVKMPVIRKLVHQWHRAYIEDRLDYQAQLELAFALFDGRYTEEKLAGMLFLQERLLPAGVVTCERDIDRFATLFTGGRIYDWNICDWFCVKVLGPLIQENGSICAERISLWRDAENLWQARSSLVAFVKVADNRIYYPAIEASCQVLIRRPERFAKTAVGWILREISKYDEPFAKQIIERNIPYFSTESLRNATKYYGIDAQSHYRARLKNAWAVDVLHGKTSDTFM